MKLGGCQKNFKNTLEERPPENHAQLQFTKEFPVIWKISWVWVWSNQFQNYPRAGLTWAPDRANQANSQSEVKLSEQQSNTNQSNASKYVRKLGGQAIWANELVKKWASQASQPSNQQSNQATSQLTTEQPMYSKPPDRDDDDEDDPKNCFKSARTRCSLASWHRNFIITSP